MTIPLFRFIRTYCANRKSRCLYDVLEVPKGATQKEIRSAFIKLSKIHHPDRQNGNQYKFQELNSAYEVLRNQKSRDLYDRRLVNADAWRGGASPFGRPSPKRPPTNTHKGPMYDYDEWLRSHYGETMMKRRREEAARRYARQFNKEAERIKSRKLQREKVEVAVWTIILIIMFFLWPPKK